ncbi:polyketide cyclase [Streptomyces sp. 150FB]|uniref:nuclear transport factor 2 family protein n=1 Tax=Streptomyces sp. 150FB TaxID=1576605 RepID=UPI0005893716|nr:nuclear transport factor 2 family protein [Streptomyces sp. 150FB]KIF75902.1 polyketide cyclase [Streptomyces sp. 150FB]
MVRELTTEDHRTIDRTLALAGHIFDRGELDRLEEIFTPEAVYDLSDVGAGTFEGIAAIRNGALKLGAGNPIAHHITNIVITGHEDDQATARSKGLIIMADGSVGSVTHRDTLRHENSGWRISRRVILAQRTPLGGLHLRHAAGR